MSNVGVLDLQGLAVVATSHPQRKPFLLCTSLSCELCSLFYLFFLFLNKQLCRISAKIDCDITRLDIKNAKPSATSCFLLIHFFCSLPSSVTLLSTSPDSYRLNCGECVQAGELAFASREPGPNRPVRGKVSRESPGVRNSIKTVIIDGVPPATATTGFYPQLQISFNTLKFCGPTS